MIIVRMTQRAEDYPGKVPARKIVREIVVERSTNAIELYKKLKCLYSDAVATVACIWASNCKEKIYEGGSFVLVREGGIAE